MLLVPNSHLKRRRGMRYFILHETRRDDRHLFRRKGAEPLVVPYQRLEIKSLIYPCEFYERSGNRGNVALNKRLAYVGLELLLDILLIVIASAVFVVDGNLEA